MGTSCRSSGVLTTATNTVFVGQCKFVSIHAVATDTAATTIRVFDNASAASGTEVARLIVGGSYPFTAEFDMHGVICSNGLTASISTGSNEAAAITIEFS